MFHGCLTLVNGHWQNQAEHYKEMATRVSGHRALGRWPLATGGTRLEIIIVLMMPEHQVSVLKALCPADTNGW